MDPGGTALLRLAESCIEKSGSCSAGFIYQKWLQVSYSNWKNMMLNNLCVGLSIKRHDTNTNLFMEKLRKRYSAQAQTNLCHVALLTLWARFHVPMWNTIHFHLHQRGFVSSRRRSIRTLNYRRRERRGVPPGAVQPTRSCTMLKPNTRDISIRVWTVAAGAVQRSEVMRQLVGNFADEKVSWAG